MALSIHYDGGDMVRAQASLRESCRHEHKPLGADQVWWRRQMGIVTSDSAGPL